MQIVPVLDILAGQVVRGIAGRRAEYRPIVSQLTRSTAPLDVARAFRDHFGLSELYVADLDAIAGKPLSVHILSDLIADDFSLWVDAGIGADGATLQALANLGIVDMVVGLESLSGADELRFLLKRFGLNLIFSLDLKEGRPMAQEGWQGLDAVTIADCVVDMGVRRILVLDLAGVGVDQGSKTADLCGDLRAQYPHLEIATGGGIRGPDDLQSLQKKGIDKVLVASALHDRKFVGAGS